MIRKPKHRPSLTEQIEKLVKKQDYENRIANMELQIRLAKDNIDLFFRGIVDFIMLHPSTMKHYFLKDLHDRFYQISFWCCAYNFCETACIKDVKKDNDLYDMCLRFDNVKHYSFIQKYRTNINKLDLSDTEKTLKELDQMLENIKKDALSPDKTIDMERIIDSLKQELPPNNVFPNFKTIPEYEPFYLAKIDWMENFIQKCVAFKNKE